MNSRRQLLQNVADRDSLTELLSTAEQEGGLGWPVHPALAFVDLPALAGGASKIAGANVARLIPQSEADDRLVLLAEFHSPYARRDLRDLLRELRRHNKTTESFPGITGIGDTIFIVAAPDYADVRFVLFEDRPKPQQPRIKSFGWSRESIGRTVLDRNLDCLRFSIHARWTEAWDIEALTTDFFKHYREVFFKVEEMVTGLQGDKRLFVQRLFNRLLFIQFLSRKGWMRFGGDSDYLRALWNGRSSPEGFYYGHLLPLFFAGLNNQQGRNLVHDNSPLAALIGEVPFLNGGLFERAEDDGVGETVPDGALDEIVNKLFAHWNFTITESTPDDIDVAIDPEMLGKVFEELVTGRHETGSYYTPRPIVAFMCREALKGYLGGCEKLVDEHDAEGIGLEQARALIKKLEAIKVCDPACGSGAYLLGMLQEIHALQRLLDTTAHELTARDDHERKLKIIENCLYGVDLDPFAVNIAWLRLWLALVIDDPRNPLEQPGEDVSLPNLDVKIEVGDSLLARSPRAVILPEQLTLAKSVIEQYRTEKGDYMRAHSAEEKQRLREAMAATKQDIRDFLQTDQPPAGSFDWAVEYVEVFLRESAEADFVPSPGAVSTAGPVAGFDAVLANPPYVRQEKIKQQFGDAYKAALVKAYPETGSGTADLYVYFYTRAVQLLKPGGMLVFISSNKWFRAAYGEKLRKYIAEQTQILSITDFQDLPVFSATAYAMIFIARRTSDAPLAQRPIFTVAESLEAPYPDVRALAERCGEPVDDAALIGGDWVLAEPSVLCRLRSMRQSGTTLGEYVAGSIFYGVKSGLDEAYVIESAEASLMIAECPQAAAFIKPFVAGDEIKRWRSQDRGRFIIYATASMPIDRLAPIRRRLEAFRPRLQARAEARDGLFPWFALQRPRSTYANRYSEPKIIYPDIAKEPRFAYDERGTFGANTTYFIPTSDLYLLGVLNSGAVHSYFLDAGAMVRGGYLRFFTQYVAKIPIPAANSTDRDAISKLVRQCIDAEGTQLAHLEAEIDARVEYLYFHQHEAATYDEWVAKREAEKGTAVEAVRKLVEAGESGTVEFKQSLEYVDPASFAAVPEPQRSQKLAETRKAVIHSALKSICAFRNAKGGTLLLGVHDTDGVVGIEPDYTLLGKKQDRDGFENKLTDLIKGRLRPIPTDLDIHFIAIDGKTVCRIDVAASPVPLYLDNRLYVRLGNSTEELTGRDLEDWLVQRKHAFASQSPQADLASP